MSILKWQVKSITNFGLFFIVITRNSPLSFKLINFLLCIKGSNESPNFENFLCSGENLPNSCHFPNHKSVFLLILHNSLVSWDIPSILFLDEILYAFSESSLSKYKLGEISNDQSKFWNFALWWAPFVNIKFQLKKIQRGYLSFCI